MLFNKLLKMGFEKDQKAGVYKEFGEFYIEVESFGGFTMVRVCNGKEGEGREIDDVLDSRSCYEHEVLETILEFVVRYI